MKRILFLILLLVVFHMFAKGQNAFRCNLLIDEGANKNVVAEKYAVKIVLALSDSVSFGYAHPHIGNEIIHLVGDQNATSWLNRSVNERLGCTGKARLLWYIKGLSMSTDTSGRFVFCNLKVDIYKVIQDVRYSLMRTVDTVVSVAAKDSTGYSIAFNDCMDLLYLLSIKNYLQTPNEMPGFDFVDDVGFRGKERKLSFPVFNDSIVKVGVYKNYTDFLQNTPSIVSSFWLEPDLSSICGSVKLLTASSDGSFNEIFGAWGLCFGGNEIYKLEGKLLIPIERLGNSLIISRFQEPLIRKNQAIVWRRVVHNGWPHDSNPFERKRSVQLNSSHSKSKTQVEVVATRIDSETGELTF